MGGEKVVKLNEKADILIKYFVEGQKQNKYSVPDDLVGKFVISRIYSDKIKVFF